MANIYLNPYKNVAMYFKDVLNLFLVNLLVKICVERHIAHHLRLARKAKGSIYDDRRLIDKASYTVKGSRRLAAHIDDGGDATFIEFLHGITEPQSGQHVAVAVYQPRKHILSFRIDNLARAYLPGKGPRFKDLSDFGAINADVHLFICTVPGVQDGPVLY